MDPGAKFENGSGLARGKSVPGPGAIAGVGSGAGQCYTIVELAGLLSVTVGVIRSWCSQGLLPAAPVRTRRVYGYGDLARARVLGRLHENGWRAARIAKAVAKARRLVSTVDEALAGIDAAASDQQGAMRLADGRICTPAGQGLLFDHDALSSRPTVRRLRSPSEWFQLATEAEAAGRLDDAIIAYERSLPEAGVEALFNLGNCRYQTGCVEQAEAALRAAVAIDPRYVEAWNNLGIACSALDRGGAAIQAFRQALQLRPHYADAHFNLADALAASGDLAGARRHWRAYLTFDPNSRWAEHVRGRLQAVDGGCS